MYRVSFIKYCTYWPIASHSECYDNASKSVTQSDIYLHLIIVTYMDKSGLISCNFLGFYSTRQQTTYHAKGTMMFGTYFFLSELKGFLGLNPYNFILYLKFIKKTTTALWSVMFFLLGGSSHEHDVLTC